MSQIIGKLSNIITTGTDYEPVFGSVEFALCGYGPNLPRVPNATSIGQATQRVDIPTGSDGTFNTNLFGNDRIQPPGTYYTYTVRNENGDILQCTAHIFLDGVNYDMDNEPGFDPALPIPPLPPAIINQLEVQQDQIVFNFHGDAYTAFKAVLNQDAAIQLSNAVPGQLYTFIVEANGHVAHWSGQFMNASAFNPKPNGNTVQTFVCDDANLLWAIAGATWGTVT